MSEQNCKKAGFVKKNVLYILKKYLKGASDELKILKSNNPVKNNECLIISLYMTS